MTDGVDFRSLRAPIVQAGMGAVARHELAAAVSEAGGLGTIGAPAAGSPTSWPPRESSPTDQSP